VLEPLLDWSFANAGVSQDEFLMPAWGLGEATGIDPRQFVEAAVNPETLLVLLGQRSPRGPDETSLFNRPLAPPVGNCSEFAAWGSATANGKMLIARNTDYGLNGEAGSDVSAGRHAGLRSLIGWGELRLRNSPKTTTKSSG